MRSTRHRAGKRRTPNGASTWSRRASSFLRKFTQAAAQKKKPLTPSHLFTNFTQVAQLVRSGVAAAILPVMVENVLKDWATRIELPWIKKSRRDLGVAWHERLLDTRPKARELLKGIEVS